MHREIASFQCAVVNLKAAPCGSVQCLRDNFLSGVNIIREFLFRFFALLLTIGKRKDSAQSNLPEDFTPNGIKC